MGELRSLNAIKANREADNTLLSVREMLLDVVADIDAGLISPNKAFVITVNDEDGQYALNWGACNARSSEMISMCEVAKTVLLQCMGYIPEV